MDKQWKLKREDYLSTDELKRLKKTCQEWDILDKARGRKKGVVTWMIVHLGIGAGLRVTEISDLRVGDCHVGHGESHIFVRNGKGGKQGEVKIGENLKKHIKDFIEMKELWNEDTSAEEPLLITKYNGEKQQFSRRGLQCRFKMALQRAQLSDKYSIHCLRHTLGCEIMKKTGNLFIVQQQLRHSDIKTSYVYANAVEYETPDVIDKIA